MIQLKWSNWQFGGTVNRFTSIGSNWLFPQIVQLLLVVVYGWSLVMCGKCGMMREYAHICAKIHEYAPMLIDSLRIGEYRCMAIPSIVLIELLHNNLKHFLLPIHKAAHKWSSLMMRQVRNMETMLAIPHSICGEWISEDGLEPDHMCELWRDNYSNKET